MADGTPITVLEVASERAYVVYDPRTGHIVHVHHAFVYRGGQEPSEQQDAERAIELAQRFGHRIEGLRALRVKPDEINMRRQQHVDPKTLTLVTDRAPQPGGARAARKTSTQPGRRQSPPRAKKVKKA